MFMNDFIKYVDLLDSATVKGDTDRLRDAYAETPEGRLVQVILGNFWDNDELKAHLDDILNVLNRVEHNRHFLTTRLALLAQLRRSPLLCQGRRKSLERTIESYQRIIAKSWVALLERERNNSKYREWFQLIDQSKDPRHVMSHFLVNGLYHSDINLAAYCLMDWLEPLNYNFHGFRVSKITREGEADPIQRRLENPYTGEHAVNVLMAYRPDLISHPSDRCNNKECFACHPA